MSESAQSFSVPEPNKRNLLYVLTPVEGKVPEGAASLLCSLTSKRIGATMMTCDNGEFRLKSDHPFGARAAVYFQGEPHDSIMKLGVNHELPISIGGNSMHAVVCRGQNDARKLNIIITYSQIHGIVISRNTLEHALPELRGGYKNPHWPNKDGIGIQLTDIGFWSLKDLLTDRFSRFQSNTDSNNAENYWHLFSDINRIRVDRRSMSSCR